MGETRVNLGHLLEDLRDSYPFPAEEAILAELIANALDSGASSISFVAQARTGALAVVDNGAGMTQRQLMEYHDIAATTKSRGKGIGFAGVGAKLALLVADEVATETRRGGHHRATSWRMQDPLRAPWDYIEPPGLVESAHGTAVAIQLRERASKLTRPAFIAEVVRRHYLSLLDPHFASVLEPIYPGGVQFVVNGLRVQPQLNERWQTQLQFLVFVGRRKTPAGVGLVRRAQMELPEEQAGIAVSTYGKVIKRGWDWIGLHPQNPKRLSGLVEVPGLVEILTLNKADFLRDGSSLQKYYRYRKAIQRALEPILRQMGEVREARERHAEQIDPLQHEVERVIADLVRDFPELSPLLARRRKGAQLSGLIPDPTAELTGLPVGQVEVMTGTLGGRAEGEGVEVLGGEFVGEALEPGEHATERGREHSGRRKEPGLMIGFADGPDPQTIGWIVENTIWVNRSNPAYQRVMDTEAEPYHIILAVAWVLSGHLEDRRSPQAFIGRFITQWGNRT
jgi:hypothetical protein